MRFLKIKCRGSFNSFRQPDFHTYHKTLPLPTKTTIAGMLGSALGIGPQEVNDEWLVKERFKLGVVGKNNGKANDLWQIRKYESKRIAAYNKGEESTPYKTAVIVRELLYDTAFILYLSFSQEKDYQEINEALLDPAWALSLGREDELIKINDVSLVNLEGSENLVYNNTIIPTDINREGYRPILETFNSINLLTEAPHVVSLPVSFTDKKDSNVREAAQFRLFSFISGLPVEINNAKGFYDETEGVSFQIF